MVLIVVWWDGGLLGHNRVFFAVLFESSRISQLHQATWIIFVRYECKYADLLNAITGIWSRRHGDPLDFIFRIIFVICIYVGGVSSKAWVGWLYLVSWLGIVKIHQEDVALKTFLK